MLVWRSNRRVSISSAFAVCSELEDKFPPYTLERLNSQRSLSPYNFTILRRLSPLPNSNCVRTLSLPELLHEHSTFPQSAYTERIMMRSYSELRPGNSSRVTSGAVPNYLTWRWCTGTHTRFLYWPHLNRFDLTMGTGSNPRYVLF